MHGTCVRKPVGKAVFQDAHGTRRQIPPITLGDGDTYADETVAFAATLYMRYFPGDDVRVSVVLPDHAFAARIVPPDPITDLGVVCDPRTGDYKVEQCRISPETTAGCLRLTRAAGLRTAQIDLKRDPSGHDWFLGDMNAQGMWKFMQKEAHHPIAVTLAAEMRATCLTGR